MEKIKTGLIRIAGVVLGTALVLAAWYWASPLVVQVLDWNLAAIKWVCGLLPAPYGSMFESALRAGLAADKALLFAEGSWITGAILWALFPSRRKNTKSPRFWNRKV